MKIVVIGGSGLIGGKLVTLLRAAGHETVAAAPSTGVDTVTGEGLAGALTAADVVVDVANAPSFADGAALAFFQSAGRNLAAAEVTAGVRHHVALSIVGVDRMAGADYMRAKLAQEELVRGSGVPWTIVRATQFFEFTQAIAESGADGDTVRLPPALMQPIAADDVAATLAAVAVAEPVNGTVELAGPERIGMDELARRVLAARGDHRKVIADPQAGYFGAQVDDASLVPAGESRIGEVTLDAWLAAKK